MVGCGVDYTCQSVFFTYNGTFLGYEPIRSEYLLHTDLYPIIGIDSNCIVSCNFGINEPYHYDLLNHMKKSKSMIFQSLDVPSKSSLAATTALQETCEANNNFNNDESS